MENRVRSPAVGFEVRHEALHAGVNVKGVRIYRMVRASSAKAAPRLHPYPLSPYCSITLHRARPDLIFATIP